ncbi:MAG: hypothetical protein QM762_12380 [Chryseolinea sp.]
MKYLFTLSMTIIVPVVIGTIYWRKMPSYARLFVCFLYLSFVVEVGALILAIVFKNNMPAYYFFVMAGAPLIGYAYARLLGKRDVFKLSFLVPLIAIGEGLILGFDYFNSYSLTVFNALIIIATLYTFSRIVIGETDEQVFWLNGALFFYAVSSSVVFFSAKYLQSHDMALMQKLFSVHSYINASINLCFGISLWILSRSYSSVRS